jgi:hypothetical protein
MLGASGIDLPSILDLPQTSTDDIYHIISGLSCRPGGGVLALRMLAPQIKFLSNATHEAGFGARV